MKISRFVFLPAAAKINFYMVSSKLKPTISDQLREIILFSYKQTTIENRALNKILEFEFKVGNV